jgi:hypothetical protein
MKSLMGFILFYSLIACFNDQSNSITHESACYRSDEFKKYWHTGLAEVNAYALHQSRYGETREGTAMLIFVTEDLLKDDQVKADYPENVSDKNKVNVLKMNFTKNFVTGIYPYSMMLSVFTPVDRAVFPASLKATMSSQEWCGQVYTQMNLRGNRFSVKSHSYFQKEGDQNFSVRKRLLEDEIWNLIRLDHKNLPVGKIEVVPGLFFTRLKHTDLHIQSANAERLATDSSYTYVLSFEEFSRKLSIEYEKTFPHKILKWKEEWIENGKPQQTFGVLKKSLHIDYWTKNKNEHEFLRDSLDLK